MPSRKCSGIGRLTLIVLVGLVFSFPANARMDLEDGWEYRWGDSPFSSNGVPVWTVQSAPDQWQAIGFPSNPPGREGRQKVWFRITLPDTQWREPVVYIYSIDLIAQVWMDGQKIYQYGQFDDTDNIQFAGWPWHAIALPEGFEGKDIYFRVLSNYTDIGLWGEVTLMERSELTLYILGNSIEALLIAMFSLVIAVPALIFALLQTQKQSFASIALFAISSAVMLVAESQAGQLIWNAPLIWDFLAAGAYFLLPVAMALLLEQWFVEHKPWLINVIWKVHLLYFVVALSLAGAGVVDLSTTFPIFDGLLLTSIFTITVFVVRRVRELEKHKKVILLSYAIFASLLIIDMAVAHGVLAWMRVPVSWGALLFLLSLVVISLIHFVRTQEELQRLNQSLEEKVAERTARAEALARREQARVRLLTFENEKTRVLNDIIAELQDCRNLAQTFQVLSHRLPELCSPMKGRIYQRVDGGQAYELLSRWGYAGEPPSVKRLETPEGPPPQSQIASRYRADPDVGDGASNDEEAESLCLWVNVQTAEQGLIPVALVFVEVPEQFVADSTHFGAAKLFQALSQSIQKIGITISGISLREDLQKYSYEDALTGLKNRRYFDQLFEHESAVAVRSDKPLSLLMADIDHFKRFNDAHGHEAGDSALKAVAQLLSSYFRGSDVVCRYGGEEFVIIMSDTTLRSAFDKATELVREMRTLPIVHHGEELEHVTISIGVSSWPECSETPDSLLGQADRALYRAKEIGRDRVEVF